MAEKCAKCKKTLTEADKFTAFLCRKCDRTFCGSCAGYGGGRMARLSCPFCSVTTKLVSPSQQMMQAEELIAKLKGGDVLGSSVARVALINMGEAAVIPLVEALKHDYTNASLRHSAETILVRIGRPAVDTLTEASKDKDLNIRGFAEMVLKYIGAIVTRGGAAKVAHHSPAPATTKRREHAAGIKMQEPTFVLLPIEKKEWWQFWK